MITVIHPFKIDTAHLASSAKLIHEYTEYIHTDIDMHKIYINIHRHVRIQRNSE